MSAAKAKFLRSNRTLVRAKASKRRLRFRPYNLSNLKVYNISNKLSAASLPRIMPRAVSSKGLQSGVHNAFNRLLLTTNGKSRTKSLNKTRSLVNSKSKDSGYSTNPRYSVSGPQSIRATHAPFARFRHLLSYDSFETFERGLKFLNLILLASCSLHAQASSHMAVGGDYRISLLSASTLPLVRNVYRELSNPYESVVVKSSWVTRLPFFASDIVLVKFFSNPRNLIRSVSRIAISKVMRKAVITGSKLSVDTHSINHFSLKLFVSDNLLSKGLCSYANSAHLAQNLPILVRLPKSKPFKSTAVKVNSGFYSHKVLNKKLFFLIRKSIRRLRRFCRIHSRIARGNVFKKRNTLNRLLTSKKRGKLRVRRAANALQDLGSFRSRFANVSYPIAYSYSGNLTTTLATHSSINANGNTSAEKVLRPNISFLKLNEFSHQFILQKVLSPFLIKLSSFNERGSSVSIRNLFYSLGLSASDYTNLYPTASFSKKVVKRVKRFVASSALRLNITPWFHNTIIRFFEHCSGNRVLLQYYLSIAHRVDPDSIVLYKRWMPRMASYERKLGHRFFLEEALHIIHLSFRLHDSSLVSSWLKAMIKRISFWKTRSIFRFLKYLFNNYLERNFDYLGIRGFKIRLKGKISAAGNSRKRNIIFRSGKTSYSSVNLKCLHTMSTISTFTGVMGFQVWVFY